MVSLLSELSSSFMGLEVISLEHGVMIEIAPSFGLRFGFPRQKVCAPFESCLLVMMQQYFVLHLVLPASMILPEHYS